MFAERGGSGCKFIVQWFDDEGRCRHSLIEADHDVGGTQFFTRRGPEAPEDVIDELRDDLAMLDAWQCGVGRRPPANYAGRTVRP